MNKKILAVIILIIVTVLLASIEDIEKSVQQSHYRKETLEYAYNQLYSDPYIASHFFEEQGKKELSLYAKALYFLNRANIKDTSLAYDKLMEISEGYNGEYSDEINSLKKVTAARISAFNDVRSEAVPQYNGDWFSAYDDSLESYGYDESVVWTVTENDVVFNVKKNTAYHDKEHENIIYTETYVFTDEDSTVWKSEPCYKYLNKQYANTFYSGRSNDYKLYVFLSDTGASKASTPKDVVSKYRYKKQKDNPVQTTSGRSSWHYSIEDSYEFDDNDTYEDFYENNYDDFDGIDDAEDYWDELE